MRGLRDLIKIGMRVIRMERRLDLREDTDRANTVAVKGCSVFTPMQKFRQNTE